MSTTILYLIVMRAIHIGAGTLWAGAAVFYFFFVEPAAQTLGPATPKFMQSLVEKRRYPTYMNIVSALTILSGLLLYWTSSGGLSLAWITSGPGLGFTIGALAALVVYGMGLFLMRPRAGRLGALSRSLAAADGPPDPAKVAEMQRISHEMASYANISAILLTISLLTMATARYWHF